jgi:hypothetical protein
MSVIDYEFLVIVFPLVVYGVALVRGILWPRR